MYRDYDFIKYDANATENWQDWDIHLKETIELLRRTWDNTTNEIVYVDRPSWTTSITEYLADGMYLNPLFITHETFSVVGV